MRGLLDDAHALAEQLHALLRDAAVEALDRDNIALARRLNDMTDTADALQADIDLQRSALGGG